MKTITRMELKPGMELGEAIEYQGKIVFPEGTKVDDVVISRVNRYGIMCVTVKEEVDYAETHYQRIQFDENFKAFVARYEECLNRYKGIMISYFGTKQSIDPNTLVKIYEDCHENIASEGQLLDYLYNMMPNEDELTYTQSFNAVLLCGAFANWLNLPADERKTLILCGFYYDIGKWNIPAEILWKPGKLTDEEFATVKKHPIIGFSLIRNDYNLNEHVKLAVIMHHERFDGSGYPYHMMGEKIDLYARYMAIIDTYIAMASPRSFRSAFTPLQIIESFEKSKEKYDASILLPIMTNIANSQIGSKIKLSDNTEWEVMIIQPGNLSRPILKNDNNEILNLAEHPDLSIVKMI